MFEKSLLGMEMKASQLFFTTILRIFGWSSSWCSLITSDKEIKILEPTDSEY